MDWCYQLATSFSDDFAVREYQFAIAVGLPNCALKLMSEIRAYGMTLQQRVWLQSVRRSGVEQHEIGFIPHLKRSTICNSKALGGVGRSQSGDIRQRQALLQEDSERGLNSGDSSPNGKET